MLPLFLCILAIILVVAGATYLLRVDKREHGEEEDEGGWGGGGPDDWPALPPTPAGGGGDEIAHEAYLYLEAVAKRRLIIPKPETEEGA